LNAALVRCPVLRANLHRFAQVIAAQSAQFTVCNRLHNANQRLARWLLMSQDRLGGQLVPLTHEFLAHMLGMRRASVTVALGYLEKNGFIAYRRGAAKIEDRRGLEAASCECYAAILRNEKRWKREFS
jgi:CRP-like cAMP-binding protein